MTEYNKALKHLIENGYEFKLSQYINDGFEIFKRNIGGFVGYYAIIIFIIVFLMLLSLFQYGIANLLQPVLVAGLYIVANEIIQGRRTEFRTFFKGFDFFIQLALLGIVTSLIYTACSYFANLPTLISLGLFSSLKPLSFIFMGVGYCALIYFSISYSFANMLIIFLNFQFWPAMEASRKIITKNFWSFLIFFLVIALINVLGAITFIGIFFTAPATMCMIFCAFEDIVGGAIRKYQDSTNDNPDKTTYTYNI